ncbi:MAG: hypothetical protein ACKO90_31590, partial [Microcystis panniformis]
MTASICVYIIYAVSETEKGEKQAMTRRDGERTRWTDEMLDELADSVSELRESVSEVRDSVDGVRITAQALLQIAA